MLHIEVIAHSWSFIKQLAAIVYVFLAVVALDIMQQYTL